MKFDLKVTDIEQIRPLRELDKKMRHRDTEIQGYRDTEKTRLA